LFRSRVLDRFDARGRNDGAVLRHDTVVDLVRGPSAALRGVAVASGEIVEGDAVVIAMGPWSILAAAAAGDARSAWANAPQRTRSDRHRSSVKVKRLFFFFADRHQHAWLERLDRDAIDLGEGKRMLVKGGKLNKPYQITVPENLDAVR
jgi:glycine/D-amino acid oxidase-like deaminating enzyme